MKLNRIGNKKGQFNLFQFMIVAVLTVLFFGGLMYAMGKINDVFTQVGVANDAAPHETYYIPCVDNSSATCNVSTYVNMSLASQQIFGQLNTSIQSLRIVALVSILAYAACIIITNALIKKNPLFFMAYIFVTLLAVIFAPALANAYNNLLASNIYDGGLAAFSPVNWLILNLPTFVMIIGMLGGILLFVNLIRGTSGEGGLG